MRQIKKRSTASKTASKRKSGRIQSTVTVYDGIEFKSTLEVNVYKFLKKNNLDPKYEPYTFTLWYGGETHTPFYNSKKGHLKCFKADLDDIRYTPDFYFEYGINKIYIEAKGIENDSFPMRKKMFRRYLDENIPGALYFEIRNLAQLQDMIEILQYGKIISKTKKCATNINTRGKQTR